MSAISDPHRWLKVERPPSVDDVEQTTLDEFRDVLTQWFNTLISQLQAGEIALTSLAGIRASVEATQSAYQEAFDIVFETMWRDGAQAGREASIRQHGFDISFEITRPSVETALEDNAERASEQVQSRLSGDLTEALLDAHEDGLGIDSIARLLRDTTFQDMETWQARRVAQTEVISASNKGNLSAYQDAAGVTGKEWVATDDERTRPTHNHADNQVVLLGQPFIVGDSQAMYPGSPELPISERINCRCAISPVIDM